MTFYGKKSESEKWDMAKTGIYKEAQKVRLSLSFKGTQFLTEKDRERVS